MGYGGPRFAFHVQPDYDSYTETIRHETSSRIQAHYDAIQREEDERERERKRQLFREAEIREERRLAEEKAEYRAILEARREEQERIRLGKGPMKKMTPAEKRALAYNIQRTKELAVPKKNPQPAYGGTMYGRCMHQKTRYVEFPQGRSGQPYCPGVDRDRIIPKRPSPKDLPPWIGSYSSHKSILSEPMIRKNAEEEEDYYFRDAPERTEEEKRARRAQIHAMLSRMDAVETSHEAARPGLRDNDSLAPQFTEYSTNSHAAVLDEEAPSIFSHADSNGPIVATGAKHLEYYSTRQEVDEHLTKYGGAMTAPRPEHSPDTWVKEMNLPQLQDRVVRLQDKRSKFDKY